jgi:antirestriction protein ArdC
MARQDRAPRDGGARSSIYDDITTRIIAELEAGRLPSEVRHFVVDFRVRWPA